MVAKLRFNDTGIIIYFEMLHHSVSVDIDNVKAADAKIVSIKIKCHYMRCLIDAVYNIPFKSSLQA